MAITVADLLEMQHLRLHLVSGEGGLNRSVSWTHGSDLPEPWRWLTGGELLLTNGMSFPESGADQQALIEKLDEAGASALAIGDKMYCPPLTDELLAASERLGLSVLSVEFPMPFVAISQAVAAANLLEQSDRLVRTERIYRTVQRMVSTPDNSSALREPLAQVLGCEVHVCHRESREPWYPGDPRFDAELSAALNATHEGADLRAGAFVVPVADDRDLRLIDIPTQQGALMLLVSGRHSPVDAILMQHAVTVLALELSQSVLANEHRRRNGAELLAQLFEGRVEHRTAGRQLRAMGLQPARTHLFAVSGSADERLRDVHIALWRNGIQHVVMHRNGVLYVLAPISSNAHDVLRADLGPKAVIGASAALGSTDRAAEAQREAVWALRAAEGTKERFFQYGDASPIVGVGGIDDAVALVSRVLGPLLQYEQVHDTPLLETLDSFLAHRRSWQATADALRVHRQTVLYRIRKVEELTGRTTSDTADIAELWLALRAQALLAPMKGPINSPRTVE